MDLSWVPTEDLKALKAKDLSKVSTATLKRLKVGGEPSRMQKAVSFMKEEAPAIGGMAGFAGGAMLGGPVGGIAGGAAGQAAGQAIKNKATGQPAMQDVGKQAGYGAAGAAGGELLGLAGRGLYSASAGMAISKQALTRARLRPLQVLATKLRDPEAALNFANKLQDAIRGMAKEAGDTYEGLKQQALARVGYKPINLKELVAKDIDAIEKKYAIGIKGAIKGWPKDELAIWKDIKSKILQEKRPLNLFFHDQQGLNAIRNQKGLSPKFLAMVRELDREVVDPIVEKVLPEITSANAAWREAKEGIEQAVKRGLVRRDGEYIADGAKKVWNAYARKPNQVARDLDELAGKVPAIERLKQKTLDAMAAREFEPALAENLKLRQMASLIPAAGVGAAGYRNRDTPYGKAMMGIAGAAALGSSSPRAIGAVMKYGPRWMTGAAEGGTAAAAMQGARMARRGAGMGVQALRGMGERGQVGLPGTPIGPVQGANDVQMLLRRMAAARAQELAKPRPDQGVIQALNQGMAKLAGSNAP